MIGLSIVGVVVAGLLLLYIFGKKSVHSELVMNASPEAVWSVLMDVPSYDQWNPTLVPVEGELKEGNSLKYQMIQPDGKSSMATAKVVEMVPNKLLNQYGGIPGVLTFDHRYIIEPVEGGAKVTIHEDYAGVGVPFWDPSWVQTGYENANKGLKERVEALHGAH